MTTATWIAEQARTAADNLVRGGDDQDATAARGLYALADQISSETARLREQQYTAQATNPEIGGEG